MMWYWHDGFSWWMIFGIICMVLFWGAAVTLVVWVIRKLTHHGDSGPGITHGPDPLDIAKERYARGEISKEEFEQMKKDLS